MRSLTTEIANTIMTRKDKPSQTSATTNSKPFVVASLSTKRYIPAKKDPVKKLPVIPQPTSTKERSTVSSGRKVAIQKVEPRHSLPQPTSRPAANKKTSVQKPRLPSPSSANQQQLSGKLFVRKPSEPVATSRSGRCTAMATVNRRPVQVQTSSRITARPSCVPRSGRAYKPSVDVTVGYRSDKPRRLTATQPIPHSKAFPTFPSQASPDMSSFPSQSWTIVIDLDIKRAKIQSMSCDAEAISKVDDTPQSGAVGTTKDFPGRSESDTSSTLSSPTVVEALGSPAKLIVRSGSMIEVSGPTEEPSAEISRTACTATIVSPSRHSTVSSVVTLASMMHKQAPSSPLAELEAGTKARTVVQRAFEIARAFFSSSQCAPQSGPETNSVRTLGANVSRMRNLFIPPLDESAKASKNAMTQMEIEMLRAQKKVAGGGVTDSRLERLGSLGAMAIVTKFRTADPDSPGQV